jgi:hypothetical protein
MLNDIGQVGLTVKADVFHGVTEACANPHTSKATFLPAAGRAKSHRLTKRYTHFIHRCKSFFLQIGGCSFNRPIKSQTIEKDK